MKMFVRFAVMAALLAPSAALAQFSPPPEISTRGGPVAVGQVQAQRDADTGKLTIVAAPPVEQPGGGLIQLKVFGWLEPYADALVQALIAAGFAWFMKSKYSVALDETSRAALETFVKNRASSLIADGFVSMSDKSVDVHSAALAAEANKASSMIPDALKRFGLTPDAVASRIVDAIPQVPAGAAMVAAAHAPPVGTTMNVDGGIHMSGPISAGPSAPNGRTLLPPTSGAQV